MKRTLTDLSQLSRAMFKAAPKVDEVKPEPRKARSGDNGEDALAYFSRSAANVKDDQTEALKRDMAALRAQLRDSETARQDAEKKLAAAERECGKLADALTATRKEVERLNGECGRLQGEYRKAAKTASVSEEVKDGPQALPMAEAPRKAGLVFPTKFAEVFPGEVREMVLSALSDARDAARQGTRERRAMVLDAVLAENKPSGELERRRAALKQAMKDCGYYTDPASIENLGFRLVSGRTHWKLEYGNVRMPIAKTPSDYRASLNMATDLANRCF